MPEGCRSNAKFCKPACRQAAHRRRARATKAGAADEVVPSRNQTVAVTPERRLRSEVWRAEVDAAKPKLTAGERVLVEEAERLLDLLDRMDAVISGDVGTLLTVAGRVARIEDEDEDTVTVVVQLEVRAVLAERRQTVAELRQVVKQLDLPLPASATAEGDAPAPSGLVASLMAKRAQREAAEAAAHG